MMFRRILFAVCCSSVCLGGSANANIFRWDNGNNIDGTEGVVAGPDAELSGLDLSYADLARFDLSGANLSSSSLRNAQLVDFSVLCGNEFPCEPLRTNLSQANLANADLFNVNFDGVKLSDADLTGASIQNAKLLFSVPNGLTADMLYSTSSYQIGDLTGIDFCCNDLSGWDFEEGNVSNSRFSFGTLEATSFRNANLANVQFDHAELKGTDFRGANLNGAQLVSSQNVAKSLFDAGTTYSQWTTFPPQFDPEDHGLTFRETAEGDFSGDYQIDLSDLDILMSNLTFAPANIDLFDLNDDGTVSQLDIEYWTNRIGRTWVGDANFDGEFNSADLIQIFSAGEFEDSQLWNSTWQTGDWNGDREFDTGDLVAAFQNGGYDKGPQPVAVPEPDLATSFVFITLTLAVSSSFRSWANPPNTLQ